jgi:hypothetical protein
MKPATIRRIIVNHRFIAPLPLLCIGLAACGQTDPSSQFVGSNVESLSNQMAAGPGAATDKINGGPSNRRSDERPFFREYRDRRVPAFVEGGVAPPTAPGDATAVKVATKQVLRNLPRTLFGNNAAVWDGDKLLSLNVFDRLHAVDVPLLRFPGGSTSDIYHWDGAYPPYAVSQGWDVFSQPWAASTAEYMYVVRRLGAIPLLTVNYGYSTYDTTATDGNVANAARLAADWVEYCNAPNDGSNPNGGTDWAAQRARDGSPEPFNVKYWEIGNESFGSWEVGYDAAGTTYAANFSIIADAMKAVDPNIFIGLVTQVDSPGQPWTATVLSHPGTLDRADYLVVHNYFAYFTDPAQISATGLLAQSAQMAERKQWLDDLVAANTSRAPGSVPYYFGEYNATIPNNPLEISLASGLFISKVLGEIATTGWAGASFWDVLNSYAANPPPAPDFGPGDLGFLSVGQPGLPDFTPRPSYYPFYFYTRNFGDHLVGVTSSDPQVTAYASTWTGGGTGIVLVNESAASKVVTLSLDCAAPSHAANMWVLSGDSLEAQVVTLNGQGPSTIGGGPLPETIAPYSLSPSSNGTFVVTVPKTSIASVVVY